MANADGSLKQEISYDAWGRLRNPVTQVAYLPGTEPALFLGRGYTGHEHLPWFGLINMNARLYDAALGRFLSPDPYIQMPDFTQNFNRYSYCLNNPLLYTDPSGEKMKWWHWLGIDFLTGGAISLTATVTAPSFLGTMVVTGATLYSTVVPWEHTLIFLNGFSDPAEAGKRFNNSLKIDTGMFKGNFGQVLSRWTWEFSQSSLGNTFSHLRNMIGQVDKVDYFDGATFVTNENSKNRNGVSMGNYINMNIDNEIDDDFEKFVLSTPLYMHEYGHYIDSQAFGLSYLLVIGVPSLFSAGLSGDVTTTFDGTSDNLSKHKFRWYERRANKNAARYFKKYGVNWDDNERYYPRKDRR